MRVLLCALTLLLSQASLALAQAPTAQDPLLGGYMLANSAEITYVHASSSGVGVSRGFWDCDTVSCAPDAGTAFTYPDSFGVGSGKYMDLATGDFDGDGFDEVVTVWAGADRSLFLAVEAPRRSAQGTWDTGNRRVSHSLADTIQSNLRLVSGNFDADPEPELLVGYWSMGGRIVLAMYDVSPSLQLNRVSTIGDVSYASTLGGYAQLDIAAGDFDSDGLDEIILARTVAATQVDVRLRVYDYYWPTHSFLPGVDRLVDLRDVGASTGWRDDFVVSTGDYDNDGVDEAVLVFQEGYWRNLLTWAKVDLIMMPFSVSRTLDAISTENLIECDSWNAGIDIPPGGGVSVASRDFDLDGADEVVVAGLSQITLWQSTTTWPAFVRRAAGVFNTRSGEESRRLLAIADVNARPSQSSWIPEIVVADYVASNWLSAPTGAPRVRTIGVAIDTQGIPHAITGLVPRGEQVLSAVNVSRYAVAAGDFDGDAIRLRSPRLITKEKFVQPLVVLNVPPTHYDILDGTVFDVCKQYPGNLSFKATYVKGSSSTKEFSTQQTKDWSMSSSIGGKFKEVLGLNFSTTYGEGFSKRSDSGSTIQITDQVFTSGDDYIFASVSEYAFWEYPLFVGGISAGNVLVTIPRLSKLEWLPSKSPDAFHFEPSHEVGNVLSYMTTPGLTGCFEIEDIVSADFQGYTVSEKAGKTWEVFLSQSQGTEQEWTKSLGIEVGASLSAWGIELGGKGSYSRKDVTTHKSKATRDVKITLEVGEPDAGLGTADYSVTPLVYWSTTGALVVDFATQPTIWQYPDTSLRTWWQRHYQAHADPALILPWRYDVEKTGDTITAPGLRNLTRSLRLSPSVANAGDTIRIGVRVFNYSLVATPGPVIVRLFVGDPDNGGVPLVGMGGLTELTTGAALPARGSSSLTMLWVVTGPGLTAATRIYALIDPAHTMEEIHEENNKGWTVLTVPGATAVADDDAGAAPEHFQLAQNYPNPFNPTTVVRYQVPVASDVRIVVYDMLGREVSVLVNERKAPGMHTVVFDGRGLSTGAYVYRMQAGRHVETRKFLLLR